MKREHAVMRRRFVLAAGGLLALPRWSRLSFPQEENYRRAAALVDQVLKGRKPADIEVPAAALLRAHKVIPA